MKHIDPHCLGGASAPCLISNNCPKCCDCKWHGARRSSRKPKEKPLPVCIDCKEPMAFPMGHALVCTKRPQATAQGSGN